MQLVQGLDSTNHYTHLELPKDGNLNASSGDVTNPEITKHPLIIDEMHRLGPPDSPALMTHRVAPGGKHYNPPRCGSNTKAGRYADSVPGLLRSVSPCGVVRRRGVGDLQ